MVYIQSDNDRKFPHHFDAACAMYGAMDTAVDFRLTTFDEVQSGKFNNLIRTNLFVGSTEFMREVFNKVDRKPQLPNSNRPFQKMTMGNIRNYIGVTKDGKLFVKPFTIKLFTGLVVDKYSIDSLHELADEVEVAVYDFIPNIKSEWRLYILNDRIEDSRNYGGDFRISPNYKPLEESLISTRGTLPVSYTMDIGITDNSQFIVEFNDMWAIGNYGIPNDTYLSMLRQRYFEIIRGSMCDYAFQIETSGNGTTSK